MGRASHGRAGAEAAGDVAGLTLARALGVAADAVDAATAAALAVGGAAAAVGLHSHADARGAPVARRAVCALLAVSTATVGAAHEVGARLLGLSWAGTLLACRCGGGDAVGARASAALRRRVAAGRGVLTVALPAAEAAIAAAGHSAAVWCSADGGAGAQAADGVAGLALAITGDIAAEAIDAFAAATLIVGGADRPVVALGGADSAGAPAASRTVAVGLAVAGTGGGAA